MLEGLGWGELWTQLGLGRVRDRQGYGGLELGLAHRNAVFHAIYVDMYCRLIDVYEEEAEFYIVTELVEGGELFDRIVSKSHYSEKEARDLVRIFLETMAYMHGANIVHRDLKPENLLLTSGNDIFLRHFCI